MAAEPWLEHYPPGVDWHTDLTPAPLYQLLDSAVDRFPDNNCIDFLDRKFSFSQIGAMVDRAARGFQDLGVGPGIKVGLFLPNCPQFVVSYYAILNAAKSRNCAVVGDAVTVCGTRFRLT